MRTLLALALLAACALPAAPLPAEAAESVRVAYRNAPIARVVAELARATDQTLIFDDSLRGNVTIEGPDRVTPGEARALLDNVLLLRSFAAVPAPGGGRKVVALAGAPSPWVPSGELEDSDAPVTTLLRLENASATDVVAVVQPLVGGNTLAQAYEPTNSLILSGPASRLRRLGRAVEALDRSDAIEDVFWRLRYADASELAAQVQEVLGEDVVSHAFGDARTNTLVLGLRRDSVERARQLVDRLDRLAPGTGAFQVIPLEHADPEDVAEQIRALQQGAAEASLPGQRSGLQGADLAVAADTHTHSLVVRAAPETFQTLYDVIRELDQPPPRVRVEAVVAEISVDDALDVGFDFLLPGINDPRSADDLIVAVASTSAGGLQTRPSADIPFVASFTRAPILVTIIGPTGAPVVIPIPRESFSLTLNEREVSSEVLIRPQLVVVGGEEHELFAGDNVPIVTAQAGEGGDPLAVRQDIERQDVGVTFRVRPTVGLEGGVSLEVDVERTSLRPSAAGDPAVVGPTLGEISVQSKIRLRHDEMAVIATSAGDATAEVVTGPPWLMDLPVFGWVFRDTRERSMRRYLFVAVEAEILRPEREALSRALLEELARTAPEAAPLALD